MAAQPRDGASGPARGQGTAGDDGPAAHRGWRWVRRLERAQATGLVVFLLLALGLSFPYFESTRNANEWPRLMQGIALVEDDSWSLDGPAARAMGHPGPDHAISEHDGHRYPNKPPGASVVAAVAYRMAKAWASSNDEPLTLRAYTWWARALGGLLPSVLLGWWLLVRLAPALGRPAALTAVVIYAVGTPAAAYAHLLYGHQLAAALLAIGIGRLLDASGRRTATGDDPGETRRAILAASGGLCAGLAVTVEYAAVFAGLPIAIMLLLRARSRTGIVALVSGLAGALLPIVALARYHAAAFGSALQTGYHQAGNESFKEIHSQGLLGLGAPSWDSTYTHLLSPDGGLLWWAPTVLLGGYGLVMLAASRNEVAADRRAEARTLLGVVAVYLVVLAGLSFEGGWRVGPRYFVVALPCFAIGWAYALSQLRTHAPWLGVAVALSTYAVIVNALAANLWPHLDLTNVNQPVAEVLIPIWERDLHPYGVLLSVLSIDATHTIVHGTVVVTWLSFVHLAEKSTRNLVAIALGSVVGVLGVYSTYLVEPHPRGKANLGYITDRVWEPDPQSHEPGRSIRLDGTKRRKSKRRDRKR